MSVSEGEKNDSRFRNYLEAISRNENEAKESDLKKRMTLSLIFLIAQVASFGLIDVEPGIKKVVQAVFLVLLIIVNNRCFVDAYRSIARRRPEKNLLAAIGTILAVAILHFVTAGVVLTTMAVCRFLESYIKLKLNAHLTELIAAEPSDDDIHKDDIIQILPGEVVPADGVILSGGTSIDEEIITGERIPAKKKDGDMVMAGSRNLTSEISVKVMRTGGDRIISSLIMHISKAVLTRSPMGEKYEKIARRFIIVVVAVALVMAALWSFAGESLIDAAITGISIMLIANPYAFSVAVPMTVLAAVVRGAEHGIFIRSAGILEETRDINTIVLNKRGTVTEGMPEISDIIPMADGFDLKLAGILEAGAEHPYGKLISGEAESKYGKLPEGEPMEYVEGRGIRCRYEGKIYIVGNAAYMQSMGISIDPAQTRDLFKQGKSLVFFADEKKVLGIIALRDVPKPASLKAITQMENLGLDVVMLTSDSRQTAEAVRNEIGIDHIFADILPSEKKNIVEKIRKERNKIVAMVGDGEYDAPAIEASDLGVAIGTGKEINLSSGDIVLVTDDLLDVVRAMKLSRFSVRNLRQSVAFAYTYNTVAIVFAAGLLALFTGVTMMPAAAAIFMCASQVLVALNSLRVKRIRI